MGKTAKEFKDFILKGNVVDLAVAVVIGAAFGAVVTSLVKNIFTPLLAIPGSKDFSDLSFEISGSTFTYGVFLNDLISFLSIAAVIFFFVVKPMNHLMGLKNKNEVEAGPTTKTCPECLSTIPLAARRCSACTSEVSVSA